MSIKIIKILFLLSLSSLCLAGDRDFRWSCTSFAINDQGYIATAGHCVQGGKVFAVLINHKYHLAKLVEADYKHDVAILKTDYKTSGYTLDNSIRIGEKIYILGYPLIDILGPSLKQHYGYVESKNKSTFNFSGRLCHGNSGGPIINSSNKVIGVLTNGYGSGVACSSLGLARNIGFVEAIAIKHDIDITVNNDISLVSESTIVSKGHESILLFFGG